MKNNEKENNNNSDYINKLREVFEYYCQYGERLNSKILKSHKYIKLFRESGLMDKKLDNTRLELIYKSINKNNQMNFDQFLNSLLKIASYKYEIIDKKDIKKAVQKIIYDNLYPLYYAITNTSDNALDNDLNLNHTNTDFNMTFINKKFENILYSDLFKEILVQVIPVLFDLYRTSFTNETSISDDLNYIKNTSLKNYFTLIKNLEIIPQLLSKSTCYQIYKYEINNSNADESIKNNQNFYFEICQKIDFLSMNTYERSNKNIFGKYFIFFKFVRVLVKMSQITFEKIFETNSKLNNKKEDNFIGMKPEEMFVLFLQKIEQSEGFSNFTKNSNVTHNYKTTTIIPPNFKVKFELMNYDNEEKNTHNTIQDEKEEKIDIYKKLDAYEPKYINYINEVYGKDLLILFRTIVSFGDQFNFQYMKSKAFLKFLIDSNLVKDKNHNFGLKLNDIDIFFIKMCLLMKNNEQNLNIINNDIHDYRSNYMTVNVSNGEIDFPTFIISIEILARLLFANLNVKQAIDILVVDYILNNKELNNNKINEIEQKIDNLKELQNSQEMIDLLQVVHKAFYPIFIYYTKDNEGLMSNKNFMKFTKDFEIFPYLIGKVKLNSFFNGISQYSMYGQKNNTLIEHSLFVDLIALMALEMNYPSPEPSPVEKLLIFIEKISQSQGPSKIVLNTGSNRQGNGNFLDYFREVYPSFFTEEKSEEEDFSTIMQNDNDNDIEDDNTEKNNINNDNSVTGNDINENNVNENNNNQNNINQNENNASYNENKINENMNNLNQIDDNNTD